jgi:hypothetical protein
MRIIFSRKGFDTENGRVPSPIFPDGSMFSFPIGLRNSTIPYREIKWNGESVDRMIRDLGGKPTGRHAHHDPDLEANSRDRVSGWRPCFGQIGRDQRHLEEQGVGPGDLFLFFGQFQPVQRNGSWSYDQLPGHKKGVHAIFGWLQVDRTYPVDEYLPAKLPWAEDHPHLRDHWTEDHNTLYVAREELVLDDKPTGLRGAGMVTDFHHGLVLTKPQKSMSVWNLPSWIAPKGDLEINPPLSRHGKANRWTVYDDHVELKTVARGQEIVLDAERYPQAIGWAERLLRKGSGSAAHSTS